MRIARSSGEADLATILPLCNGLQTSRLKLVDATTHHHKNMGISPDAANYYNIAIEKGRSVVTYLANAENATQIEEQFRACEFAKLGRFALNRREYTGCIIHTKRRVCVGKVLKSKRCSVTPYYRTTRILADDSVS